MVWRKLDAEETEDKSCSFSSYRTDLVIVGPMSVSLSVSDLINLFRQE